MLRLSCCTVLFLAGIAVVAGEVSVSFLDATERSYLKERGTVHQADGVKDLAAVVTSLLNVPSVSRIDAQVSDQVAEIIRADPFSKPEAVALINVAGATSGLLQKAQPAQTFRAENDGDVVGALVALATAPGVEHSLLDVGSLPGCGESCLESMLQECLDALSLDANYTVGSAVFRGQLAIRTQPGAEPVLLDMQQVADRLLAVELVSTLKTSQHLLDDIANRKAGEVVQQPQLVKRTLVSLQAVKEAYGQDSSEFQAASLLIQALLDAVITKLQTGFSDRLVVVVTAFAGLKDVGSDVVNMLGGTASIHAFVPTRSLLASGQKVGDTYTDQFTAWVTMWAVFFLLLFFALAGCHCLRTMKFKQDSLLYGKNKSE